MAKNTTYKPGTPVPHDYDDDEVHDQEDAVLNETPKPPPDPAQEKRDQEKKEVTARVEKRMDEWNLSRADAENREYERKVLQEGGHTTSPPLPRDRLAPEQPPTPHEGISPGDRPNSATNPRLALNNPKQDLVDKDRPEKDNTLPETPATKDMGTQIDGVPAHVA